MDTSLKFGFLSYRKIRTDTLILLDMLVPLGEKGLMGVFSCHLFRLFITT
jgi:hypothetical protein